MKRIFFKELYGAWRSAIVEVPYGKTFATWEGPPGEEHARLTYKYDDHHSACEGFMRTTSQLLDRGFIEELCWLRYEKRDGDSLKWLDIKPPVTPWLSWRNEIGADGEPLVREKQFDTLLQASLAFSELVKLHTNKGYEHVVPQWDDMRHPSPEQFEEKQDPHPGSDVVKHRYWQRKAAPHDEFGPEYWYHEDGTIKRIVFQVCTKSIGSNLYISEQWEGPYLQEVSATQGSDDTVRRGYEYLFNKDGTTEIIKLFNEYEDSIWREDINYLVQQAQASERGESGAAPADGWEPASDEATIEEILAEVRGLMDTTPSRELFLALCRKVEQASILDKDATCEVLLPYMAETLATWPASLKQAPLLWINKLSLELLPTEALSIVSALCVSPALTTDYEDNPLYPPLMRWIKQLGPDTPALEGLSLSLRTSLVDALRAEMADDPHTSCHPKLESNELYDHSEFNDSTGFFSRIFCCEEDDLGQLLSSPLCRELRVLDLSMNPYQGDERGLLSVWMPEDPISIDWIASKLASEQLEVLDLQGNIRNSGSTDSICITTNSYTRDHLSKLSSLKQLNVSGGIAIGNRATRAIADNFPALETLSMTPGYQPMWDDDDDSELDTSWGFGYNMEHNWYISDVESIHAMQLRDEALYALAELEHLRYVNLMDYRTDVSDDALAGLPAVIRFKRDSAPLDPAHEDLWQTHFGG